MHMYLLDWYEQISYVRIDYNGVVFYLPTYGK